MFWRFGLNRSAIDDLLDKEDLTLEDLLYEDELLQECKAHNNKLIEYLRDPVILSQLLNYIIRDDLDDRQRFKYPYVACEVLCCEIWAICEAVIDNVDLLNSFWQLLDRPPPLNPLQASYFTKVNVVFMQKKMSEMVKFIQSIPNVVKKMLNHMETSAITDLLLKLISVEEYPEGAGVIDWLNSEGLVEALISRLDPNLDPDMHSTTASLINDIIAISQSTNPEQGGVGPNALSRELISEKTVTQLVDYMLDCSAPNSTSTLTNGVNIFIQIIQKNNSDYNEEMLSLSQQQQHHHPVIDLSDMLRVLANRIGEFKALLENPKSVSGQIETTIGKMVPLGFERFRICELFAELLHCSNMSLLNTIRRDNTNGFFELKNVGNYNDYGQASDSNVPDGPQKVDESQSSAMDIQGNEESKQKDSQQEELLSIEQTTKPVSSPILMEIVEETSSSRLDYDTSQTNNFNGSVPSELPVGDILKSKFVEHKIMPTCLDLFFNFKWNNFIHTVVYDMIAQIFNGRMDIGYNKALAISVFTDGQLTKRITMAQRLNDSEVEKPKGIRLGYMGHLTFIAEEVVKLLDRYAVEIGEKVREYIEAEDWQEYVSKTLRETRERDRAPLGGQRPSNHDSMSPSREESEEEDEEDDTIEAVDGGDMASDQFARYLCQQITNDLPDKFGSSDESDDDDEGWMGDEFERDDFEMRGNFPNPSMLKGGDPFLEEDFGGDSDEEDNHNPSQWPSNLQERKQLLTVADWAADFQSAFKTSNTTQASDATSSTAAITTPNTNEVSEVPTEISSTEISNLKPTITNVQEINSSVNNVKDEHENDLILVTAKSNVIDNSHKQESTDTVILSKSLGGEEGKVTNFATFDKMVVNVETSDDSQNSQNDVQKKLNEKIQEKDMKTL